MIEKLTKHLLTSIIDILVPNYGFSLNPVMGPPISMFETRGMGDYGIKRSRLKTKKTKKSKEQTKPPDTLTGNNCFSVSLSHVNDNFKRWINNMLKADHTDASVAWSKKEFGSFNINQVEVISNTSAFLLTLGKSDDKFHNSSEKSWHIVHVEQSSDKNKVSVSSYQELFLSGDSKPEIEEVKHVSTGKYILTLIRNRASKDFEVIV